ncbi:MAG TPA: acetate kinase, partial [Gemmatales bacterium]|nr:acetate kinase [Gemmatales bacterium]
MYILIANLGSTSFKYRLFDMANGEKLLARGGVERIGSDKARTYATTDKGSSEYISMVADHAAAVEGCLKL